jgi:hypothetical protein
MKHMTPSFKVKLSARQIRSLSKIVRFSHSGALHRFSSDYAVSLKESRTIFEDLMRFLWLTSQAGELGKKIKLANRPRIGIKRSLAIVDEMWHVFLLFTKDYEDFSRQHFNTFFDHNPGYTVTELKKMKVYPYSLKTDPEWELQKQITRAVYGNKVYRRWYVTYKRKYDPITIKKMQLKALKNKIREDKYMHIGP